MGTQFFRAIVLRTQRGHCTKWNKADASDGGNDRFKAVRESVSRALRVRETQNAHRNLI